MQYSSGSSFYQTHRMVPMNIEWLESIHLGDYAEKFREQQMDGPALVRLRMLLEDPDPLKHAVWRRQLEDECGLRTLGHFLCFWQHLQQTA